MVNAAQNVVASPAFSHVAIVPAGAATIYVGDQNGVDATGSVVSSDIAEQSSRAIDNASIALEAAGASLADVVQWSVLIDAHTDLGAAYGAIGTTAQPRWSPAARHRCTGRGTRRAGCPHRGERDRRSDASVSQDAVKSEVGRMRDGRLGVSGRH